MRSFNTGNYRQLFAFVTARGIIRRIKDELSSTTQGISRKGSRSSIQSAADYLRAVLCSNGPGDEIDEGELAGFQWRSLKAHCESSGLIIPESIQPTKRGGAEHDILFDQASERVWKFTKYRQAGYAVDIDVDDDNVMMLPATPLQYLDRWRIGNKLFIDDVEFLGVSKSREGSRMVISQRVIVGDDATWDEIERRFVEEMGFKRIDPPGLDSCGGYHSRAYWRGRFAIFDVRPPNCVRTKDGEILPIDVIPMVCTRREASCLAGFVVE